MASQSLQQDTVGSVARTSYLLFGSILEGVRFLDPMVTVVTYGIAAMKLLYQVLVYTKVLTPYPGLEDLIESTSAFTAAAEQNDTLILESHLKQAIRVLTVMEQGIDFFQ
ncbi:uncharacterized protein [Macrobrachium rosenbergii]|uniref:uncharacterized protein n=1 Tax=Macrobrachium rosenbergii TaxID=79674 RepID=UPI0034D79CAE